jgi:hypothetical protein
VHPAGDPDPLSDVLAKICYERSLHIEFEELGLRVSNQWFLAG